MFSIFKKNKKVTVHIGNIVEQDMHSHILPGIDDGAADVDISISLIRGMMACGIKKFIGTPHIMSELHKNNRDTITNAYQKLKTALDEQQIEIAVRYAAEYMIDENFPNLLKEGNLLTVTGNKILVETPFYYEPIDIEDILFQIETAGYQAILAHPERYHFVDHKLGIFKKYFDHNVELQLNILSLSGYYGSKEKEVAEKLLDAGLYTYIGTDLHHERHLKRLSHIQIDRSVLKKLENTDWLNKHI
ncbi:histidinol phosphatase [Taibaiella sp. KBW10]|uniref:tyrosine-protein phosphatase n=1 Tax=Taibaiella sp. KBW10 TaxID=2153357 RepID=UPI000F5A72B6|nr:CpsB/CapC family capsule biosynthesis tyrosine phosphatase [Taibaiella sp. KBW10]RQO31914.1 histidinol phosphatase [Taibaiella sp. KBW10]